MAIGQTIYIWRSYKKMTQEDLAKKSGVSRPNLSAIEQGARDLTVKTLRRIASALGVKPGILVDDVLPEFTLRKTWDRESLDRVARRAIGERTQLSAPEKKIARIVKLLAKKKLGLAGSCFSRTTRQENVQWLVLKKGIGEHKVAYILSRVEKLIKRNM